MANLKNIADLPVAESAEGLNLIVNDNGAAKQIAASAVGGSENYDFDILCEASDWSSITNTSYSLVSGDVANALDKFRVPGTFPKVRIRFILGETSDGDRHGNIVEFAEVVPDTMYLSGEGFRFGWMAYQEGETRTGVVDLSISGDFAVL